MAFPARYSTHMANSLGRERWTSLLPGSHCGKEDLNIFGMRSIDMLTKKSPVLLQG